MGNQTSVPLSQVSGQGDTVSSIPNTYGGDSMSASTPSGLLPNEPTPVANDKYARHPGSLETIHNKAKDVFPMPWEGARFVINKGLSSHFQVTHSFTMSNLESSGFKFGATYVGTQKFSETEVFPVFLAECSPGSGEVSAHIIHQFHEMWKLKFVSQMKNRKAVATQLTSELRWPLTNLGVTMANVDLEKHSGTYLVDFMQTVLDKHAVGFLLMHQQSPQFRDGGQSLFSLGGRLTGNKWSLTSTFTPMQGMFHACYHHKVDDNFQLATEFEADFGNKVSAGSIGYQYEIPKVGFTFKAQLDSNFVVGASLEKKMTPFPCTFALTGVANHVKSQYRFGIGLNFG